MSHPHTTLILAGGTGGHIFPGLALAEALRQRGDRLHWLGSTKSMEAERVPQAGIDFYGLPIQGLRGKGLAGWLSIPWRLLVSFFLAWRYLRRIRPTRVIGFGGFASGPGGMAAWVLRIPLYIHEQNARPGLTNRYLAPYARAVLTAFPSAFAQRHPHLHCVGNPVRQAMLQLPPAQQRYTQRSGPLRVLVVGGSLGAQILNTQVPIALSQVAADHRPQVRHQAGRGKYLATQQAYQQVGQLDQVAITEFIEDMAEALAWADVVICRAGALTIAEMMAVGVAAILVPYPYAADDHQTHNARYLADQQAARLVPQTEHLAQNLASQLNAPAASLRAQFSIQAQRAQNLAPSETLAAILCVLDAC